ncbi:hypothetical protein [Methylobacterium sp. sgz302541]|uniref:hypothetical protein n=1 Tax=unclassified Methylobacterium TaxID=2615210 RepID=UPI003D3402F9
MKASVPNGFHQAIVSATVFLAGITFAYLKLIVLDEPTRNWTFFEAVGALLAFAAIVAQAETLRRALRIENDDPLRFARTARLLSGSVWILLGSGIAFVLAHWWQPFPGLVDWLNRAGS